MREELFLAFIVSIDTYLAAAAYCNSGIRIPVFSAAVINAVGAAVLSLSIMFSEFIKSYISPVIFHRCGIAVLTVIGLLTILKSVIRNVSEHLSQKGSISLKTGKCSLVLRIYLDDTAADADNSKTLSAPEAFTLALASSLDSAATGIGVGSGTVNTPLIALMTFLCGCGAIFLGNITGKRLSSMKRDLSWIGGILLIAFAFMI